MNKVATRVLTLAMFSMAVTAAPLFTKAYAAGSDTPSPPASSTKDKKKGDKSSSIEDPKFLAGYRTAYTTIYDHHDALPISARVMPLSTRLCFSPQQRPTLLFCFSLSIHSAIAISTPWGGSLQADAEDPIRREKLAYSGHPSNAIDVAAARLRSMVPDVSNRLHLHAQLS